MAEEKENEQESKAIFITDMKLVDFPTFKKLVEASSKDPALDYFYRMVGRMASDTINCYAIDRGSKNPANGSILMQAVSQCFSNIQNKGGNIMGIDVLEAVGGEPEQALTKGDIFVEMRGEPVVANATFEAVAQFHGREAFHYSVGNLKGTTRVEGLFSMPILTLRHLYHSFVDATEIDLEKEISPLKEEAFAQYLIEGGYIPPFEDRLTVLANSLRIEQALKAQAGVGRIIGGKAPAQGSNAAQAVLKALADDKGNEAETNKIKDHYRSRLPIAITEKDLLAHKALVV